MGWCRAGQHDCRNKSSQKVTAASTQRGERTLCFVFSQRYAQQKKEKKNPNASCWSEAPQPLSLQEEISEMFVQGLILLSSRCLSEGCSATEPAPSSCASRCTPCCKPFPLCQAAFPVAHRCPRSELSLLQGQFLPLLPPGEAFLESW